MTRRKASKSRADRPDYFDFNATPKALPPFVNAARAIKAKHLAQLFRSLDMADEQREANSHASTVAALEAVVEFLRIVPQGRNGRFSRPLEILLEQYRPRAASVPRGHAMPATGAGSGGVAGRANDQRTKASAAHAASLLMQTGMTLDGAASVVAEELARAQFGFAGRRGAKRAEAVKAWRRDYYPSPRTGRARLHSPISTYCISLRAQQPVRLTRNARDDRAEIQRWFRSEIARVGYGAVL